MFDRAKSKYLQAFESLHKLGDVAMSMSERGEKYEVKNAHWVCKPSFYKSVCMYVCMYVCAMLRFVRTILYYMFTVS